MSKGTVLILGARSEIGMAIAHHFARDGYDIQLAARGLERLEADKSNIELRYRVAVTIHEFDALDSESHDGFVQHLPILPNIAVCAVGYMGDQLESQRVTKAATLVFRTNYEGPASILAVLADEFEKRGAGCLVGISSVAGERGRAANYVYGSAKAGFSAFLSGLRNRLAHKGVHVLTVLPGFVATRMTEGLDLPRQLTASPEDLAAAVVRAVAIRKDVVYFRPIWRFVMLLIRHIPERIFKKLKI